MKKLFTIVLCIGLLSNSGILVAQTPKQKILKLWKCRPTKAVQDSECTQKDIAQSKKWLLGSVATVLVAILAGIGVAVTVSYIKEEQKAAKTQVMLTEIESEMKPLELKDLALHKQYNDLELMQQTYMQELAELKELLIKIQSATPKNEDLINIQEDLIRAKEKDLESIQRQMIILKNIGV